MMPRPRLLLLASSGASGVLFGIGLAVARMTDPKKVKDFLDFAAIPEGGWDPSLAFVMSAAALVAFFGLRSHKILRQPLAAARFHEPWYRGIDAPLVVGSTLFGIGWGLAGLCPGPAIADLAIAPANVILFVAAMLAGSFIGGILPLPYLKSTTSAEAAAE